MPVSGRNQIGTARLALRPFQDTDADGRIHATQLNRNRYQSDRDGWLEAGAQTWNGPEPVV